MRRVIKCSFACDSLIILRWVTLWDWQDVKVQLLTPYIFRKQLLIQSGHIGHLVSYNCIVHIRIGMPQALLYRYLIIRHVWELIVYYVCVCHCVYQEYPKACMHWPHSRTHTCMHTLTTLTYMHACIDHTHAHTHTCMYWPHSCTHTWMHALTTLVCTHSAYSAGMGGGGQWVCLLCCRRRLLSLPAVTAFSAVRSLHRTWLQKMGAKSSTLGSPILLVTALDHA